MLRTNKRLLILMMVLVMLLFTAFTEPEELPTYDTDYMQLVIDSLACGNLEEAEKAMALRNEKINALGLPNAIIDTEKLYLVAKITHAEAGSVWLSDDHQQSVASVLINREASPEFPDTVKDCIYQPGQYYSINSSYFASLIPTERALVNALYVLENGSILPSSVVFQANFRQGSGTYKTITDAYLGSSYFCYSSRPALYE